MQGMMSTGTAATTKVLVLNGRDSPDAAEQLHSTLGSLCEGSSIEIVHRTVSELIEHIPLVEDENDMLRYDLSLLPHLYDVLIVCTGSEPDGSPQECFGPLFLSFLIACELKETPLVGLQHVVLGEGTGFDELLMNIPRLTDRYLSECGSRCCIARAEIDDTQGVRDVRDSFARDVIEAVRALPAHDTPPACHWTEASKSHRVIAKSVDELAVYRPKEHYGGPLGICEWGFTAVACVLLAMGLAVCVQYHMAVIQIAASTSDHQRPFYSAWFGLDHQQPAAAADPDANRTTLWPLF